MVFTEKDLNRLDDLFDTYYKFSKEMDTFYKEIEGRLWHSSRPNCEAFHALAQFNNTVSPDQMMVVKLLCELAHARSQSPVDWEKVEILEEMLMEF